MTLGLGEKSWSSCKRVSTSGFPSSTILAGMSIRPASLAATALRTPSLIKNSDYNRLPHEVRRAHRKTTREMVNCLADRVKPAGKGGVHETKTQMAGDCSRHLAAGIRHG